MRNSCDQSGLSGGSQSVTIATPVPAAPNFEICVVASQCLGGSTGTFADGPGGELNSPSQLAFNQATDHLYVSDQNGRITEFDADGNLVRVWGAGVVQAGGSGNVPTNEVKRLSLFRDPAKYGVSSGSFALVFEGQRSADIAHDATVAAVQSALDALPNVDPGELIVSGVAGGPWDIEFAGRYADAPVALEVDPAKLANSFKEKGVGEFAALETLVAAGGFEICTVEAQCLRGRDYGGGAGQLGPISLSTSVPLAIGPTGHVFVADPGNARIQQYEADGDFVRAWGWGVDTDSAAFEICTAASTCEGGKPVAHDATNNPLSAPAGQFARWLAGAPGQQPSRIAVDGNGIVYASNVDNPNGANSGPERLERFDSAQASAAGLLLPAPIRSSSSPTGAPGPLSASIGALEADPGNGHLYVLDGSTTRTIAEISTAGAGSLVDTHLAGNPDVLSSHGLGYDEGTDRLFVSAAAVSSQRVVIAGAAGSQAPLVTLDEPQVTGPTSADFTGEITPDGPQGIDTLYRFEYRKVGATAWTPLPAGEVSVGFGDAPVEVTQPASSLESGAKYEVRLSVRKEFGAASVITEPLSFEIARLAPEVETRFPQRRDHTSATFSGTVDAKNLETTYRFEYGLDQSYGHSTAPQTIDAGAPEPVAVEVAGLAPNTTYHYRLVADNGIEASPGVTLVEGEDVAFTTRPAPSSLPQRGWELVSPPFKLPRSIVQPALGDGENANPGVPSLDGDTFLWQVPIFGLTDDVGYPASGDHRLFRRTASGWENQTLNTVQLLPGQDPNLVQMDALASSGDLLTQTVHVLKGDTATGGLLPTLGTTPNRYYTRRPGTGTQGYTPWLTHPDQQFPGLPPAPGELAYTLAQDSSLVNDDGSAMARAGRYFDLADDPETSADEDPTDATTGGVYLQRSDDPGQLPAAPKEVANACTGTGAGATQLPARVGSGLATDTIGARPCEAGEAIGASLGGGGNPATYITQTGNQPAGGPSTMPP